MKWFREHVRITFLLIVVVALASVTVASFLHQGDDSWLGRQVNRTTSFLQEPVQAAGNGLGDTVRGLFRFRSILRENETLVQENEDLRKQLIDQALTQQDLFDLQELSAALSYVNPQEYLDTIAATIIATDESHWYKIFTINVGTKQGVHENAIVINGDGLVGRILEVGPTWAKVISIVDEANNVSFQVFRDLNLLGILAGDGSGNLTGYMLDEEADVIEGDVLITSGLELYPRGIPVGKVSKVTWDQDALLRTVIVEPAVNFANLRKVNVIVTELPKEEMAQ